MFFVVGTFIPFCFQFSSLIFGIIRKKKNKKLKLQADLHNQDYIELSEEDYSSSRSRHSKSGFSKSLISQFKSEGSFFDPPLEEYIEIAKE